jgi:hypothetical protein
MKKRLVIIALAVHFVSATLIHAQNPISCSSGTACTENSVPLFASSGGSATVSDSILTQNGNTIAVAGNLTTSSSNGGVNSEMTGSGNGIAAVTGFATTTGAAGYTYGVFGQSASNNGRGVFGLSAGNNGVGVLGENNNGTGTGIIGKALPGSSGWAGTNVGVWGDSGRAATGLSAIYSGVAGVLGTSAHGQAGAFYNDSSSYYTLVVLNTNGSPFYAANLATHKGCEVDSEGNLYCSGSKNAVVSIDGGKRKVAMSAIESPANWFEDFGSAQLINGVALVRLDPEFTQTVNTQNDYRVFPVPNGDCKGLYIASKGPDSFEVRELGGGTSNISFDYRITAIRRDYETVRFADHTNDLDPTKMPTEMRKDATHSSSAAVAIKATLSSAQAKAHD